MTLEVLSKSPMRPHRNAADNFEWNDAAIATLRVLWGEGHSTSEIGRRMGTTKNSIVGKAGRIGLPARPNPIIRRAPDAPQPPPRNQRVTTTLPSLDSINAEARRDGLRRSRIQGAHPVSDDIDNISAAIGRVARSAGDEQRQMDRVTASERACEPVVFHPAAPRSCLWPMWGREKPTHRYCEAKTAPGGVYCPTHHAVAYTGCPGIKLPMRAA